MLRPEIKNYLGQKIYQLKITINPQYRAVLGRMCSDLMVYANKSYKLIEKEDVDKIIENFILFAKSVDPEFDAVKMN